MIKPTLSQYIRVRICQRVEPILECIDVLYDAWNKDLPAAAEKDRSYIDPNYIPDYNADDEDLDEDDYDVIDNPEDEDYFDGKSIPCLVFLRLVNFGFLQNPLRSSRKLLSEVTSNTNNRSFLSKMTLSSHNRQIGETPWTDVRIREWGEATQRDGQCKFTFYSAHPFRLRSPIRDLALCVEAIMFLSQVIFFRGESLCIAFLVTGKLLQSSMVVYPSLIGMQSKCSGLVST